MLKNGKCLVALTMCDGDADASEKYKKKLEAQKCRIFPVQHSENLVTTEVKVPTHGCTEANSGVAALANCKWLLSTRRRCHPGSLQYMRQRESDFDRFSASVNKQQFF